MAKKRKGTGSIITMRRLRGVGRLNNPASFAGAAVPPALGAGLTALATMATRYWAKPSEGETPTALFKWAPGIGLALGSVFSLGLYYIAGAPGAISSFASSAVTSAGFLGHDYVVRNRIGEYALALPPTMAEGTGNTGSDGTAGYRRNLGVVVPERVMGPGVNGIVYEDAASRDPRRRYGVGSYGEEVRVSGVDPQAFGTPGFGARA